ncbi:MAG: GtrA family protein [Myxococcales bacterium]|nr:GtrA family protein [Myxococcales bacterium]
MWKRFKASWLVRGLGTGAMTSVIDHGVGVSLAFFGAPTRVAAMSGKVVGAVFSYFAHRTFTFTDHQQPLAGSGARYVGFVVLISLVHGQAVVWLRDGLGVPYVVAAVLADVTIVTPAWMLALRYVVFPSAKAAAPPIDPPPPGT